ncbi:alpha/beta fold hydrolase [Streptomyces sp. RerS4]|uniref:thioesterase II family protein n=1 Tax=Streptomyces sp. RerS4 TaxID=2942449 RepID=UPI00201C7584|nr:alpha/beta fold hydrolase [Streptomyces sp. RerS4]UQX05391.1 alpha/beta fold hydrolase [Streptomyces sp. RerS4]
MRWLERTTPRPEAGWRLICFPHEGGSARFFDTWGDRLTGTEVYAVRYPGRGPRSDEPCPTEVHQLAAAIARAVLPLADRPVALFGHSLGAWVAFETARWLQRAGSPVGHLFASGAHAPQTRTGLGAGRTPYGHDAVAAALVEIGGRDGRQLLDPALRRMVLPYVTADHRMLDGYVYRQGPPLDCPVTTVVGVSDPHVTPRDTAAWARLTRHGHRGYTAPGGRLYLTAHPPLRLIEAVSAPVAAPVAAPAPVPAGAGAPHRS